ncbi:MAG: hypothetical protein ABSB30_09710 [Terracidiphilus sp.]|jgi:hypothetical protein
MNAYDENRMKKLLQQALPAMKGDAGPGRDLWPDVLRRLNAKTAAQATTGWAWLGGAWFDGALLAGLVALVAIFPATIPVFLYYL